MADRDVERNCSPETFVETLRRLADAIERGESFRIQVAGRASTCRATRRCRSSTRRQATRKSSSCSYAGGGDGGSRAGREHACEDMVSAACRKGHAARGSYGLTAIRPV
ncbi:hypothetical protein [Nannocystis pusilla]|uniref:hypothetical protein n=1 Tax=Nannocystis pusilla TaxID=889268 RepID=UPI003B7BB11B